MIRPFPVARRSRPPPTVPHRTVELGSASVLMVAVTATAMLFVLLVADVGLYLTGRAKAVTAADAAALAAAPVTFHGFGSSGSPADEAARFAALHGMGLVSCVCPVDRTWQPRTVAVVVSGSVDLIMLGSRTVSAAAAAEFDPTRMVEDGG